MAEKDFRVRCKLRFSNQGVANGLANHLANQIEKTVNINEGQANQELVYVQVNGTSVVEANLNFPPENEDVSKGVFNHLKGVFDKAIPPINPLDIHFISMERCGHRIKELCEVIEKYIVG